MILVYCHTNLDLSPMPIWPNDLACKPEVGEYIQADNGKRLKIVTITHANRVRSMNGDPYLQPYLDLELHN